MLRGIVWRQSFVLADVVLAGFAVLVAVMVGLAVVGDPSTQANVQRSAQDPLAEEVVFATVAERSAYDSIVANGLFGPGANVSREAAPAPALAPPPPPVETETKLPLRLLGTVGSGDVNALRSAAIEVSEGAAAAKTYYIGDEVLDQVSLKEVYAKEVLLDNKRTNRIEHLRMREGSDRFEVAANRRPRRPSTPTRKKGASQSITISRNEIIRDLVQNFDEIANQIEVEVYRDSSGKVKGLTASNLSSVPLAEKLGVKDGDILTSINNEAIDSVEKIYEVIEKHRNATTFRISVIRDGKPKNIYYRLR